MPSPTSPMGQTVSFRPAQPADYGAIAAIYNEAIACGGITMDATPYSASDVQAIIQKMGDREVFLVAEQGDRLLGWGAVKRYSDRLGYRFCCETSIYLTFSQTGKGYGHQLQAALMAQAKAFQYHHIVVKIVAQNWDSVRFHQRFGFEIIGIQKEIGYANGAWQDVVIMQYLFNNFD